MTNRWNLILLDVSLADIYLPHQQARLWNRSHLSGLMGLTLHSRMKIAKMAIHVYVNQPWQSYFCIKGLCMWDAGSVCTLGCFRLQGTLLLGSFKKKLIVILSTAMILFTLVSWQALHIVWKHFLAIFSKNLKHTPYLLNIPKCQRYSICQNSVCMTREPTFQLSFTFVTLSDVQILAHWSILTSLHHTLMVPSSIEFNCSFIKSVISSYILDILFTAWHLILFGGVKF